MSETVLGIDLGTSAVKCVLTQSGRVVGVGSSPLSVSAPHPGWSEQNPADWINATKLACKSALSSAGLNGDVIKGIALSGQMHGAVLLDAQQQVLRPAILWNDNRSTAECALLSERLSEIGEIAGVPPLPGFTAPKLMWLKRHEPETHSEVRTILLPKDYIAFWLTGALGTDISDAAGTLWLDQAQRQWSDDAIAASDIDASWLPELRHGFDVVGGVQSHAAQGLGIAVDTPVFAGGADAAAGALSIGAASAGRCFISLGTSGQLLVVDDSYQPNPAQFVHAYCHTLPNLWYRMAAMLNGARPLSWFASILGCSVEKLLEQAALADTDRIPVFLPYLTGERSPHGDPKIRGSFYGLDDATSRREMCRAVVEAIAFAMRDSFDSFGDDFAPKVTIPVIGGGSRSDLVLQTLATVLGHSVARTDSGAEGPAYGAALLAEVGLGQRSISDLSFDAQLTDRFDPELDPAFFQRLDKYRRLYGALRNAI